MKNVMASVAAVSLLASASFAGTLVDPDVEPTVTVVEEDTGSSNGLLLPLLALAALAAIAADGSSASGT